jgi:hypothetical protein
MAKRQSGKTHRVFLSHSSQDLWISERIKEKIEEIGVEVWLDAVDLPGGSNVKERIREGMRSSTECLILLSPASRGSDWVRHEGGIADVFRKPTAVVLLHASDDDVPGHGSIRVTRYLQGCHAHRFGWACCRRLQSAKHAHPKRWAWHPCEYRVTLIEPCRSGAHEQRQSTYP